MVAVPSSSELLSAEEFFALPESPEGGKMELADGVVEIMSPVGFEHSAVAAEIYDALKAFVSAHKLGFVGQEAGFVLQRKPDRVRAPDVAFLRAARVPKGRERPKQIEGPPDLAVEVKSPDDREADLLRKVGEYLDAGCVRVWVVRPARKTVTVYAAEGARTLGESTSLGSGDAGFSVEGFELPVAEIFAS